MSSNKSPVFRKVVIPWYRSKAAYALAIISLLLVFLFALAGISEAREAERCSGCLWVPAVLAGLSASLTVTVTLRLIRRLASRQKKAGSTAL